MGMRIPNTLGLDMQAVQRLPDNQIKSVLESHINRLEQIYKLLYGDLDSLNDKIDLGVSGWFDDGTNFRITVTDGIITAIEDSTAGGHS